MRHMPGVTAKNQVITLNDMLDPDSKDIFDREREMKFFSSNVNDSPPPAPSQANENVYSESKRHQHRPLQHPAQSNPKQELDTTARWDEGGRARKILADGNSNSSSTDSMAMDCSNKAPSLVNKSQDDQKTNERVEVCLQFFEISNTLNNFYIFIKFLRY
jgi:hypothetical protein